MHKNSRKIGIIGMGRVGMTTAYALLLRHVADEIVLISRSMAKTEGEKLDLEHGLLFLEPTKITISDDYSALQDADIVIITAGAAQKLGQTRLDLYSENQIIIEQMGREIAPFVRNSVVIVVSNPVDILTYQLAQILDLPKGRVIGTGTMLDTARFRFHLSEMLEVHPRSIHTYVLGEHGDSAFPTLSSSTVGGQSLEQFPNYSKEKAKQAFLETRQAASKIIEAKGATYYAIGVVLASLTRKILQDQRSVLPVSVPISNYYGQSDLAISVPCIVGRTGVEQVLKIQLSSEEEEAFINSCRVIKKL